MSATGWIRVLCVECNRYVTIVAGRTETHDQRRGVRCSGSGQSEAVAVKRATVEPLTVVGP